MRQYIARNRLKMVENLLLNSKMTIKEIAYRMGYTEWHLVETQNAGHSHAQHPYHLREFTRVSLLNKYQLDCWKGDDLAPRVWASSWLALNASLI